MTLLEHAKAYEKTAGDKGFWSDDPFPEQGERWEDYHSRVATYKASKVALMHSELSEALEGIRKPGPDGHCPDFTSEEVEMADAVIRILNYCYHYGLRLDEAMAAKAAYNAKRPYKHGKAI